MSKPRALLDAAQAIQPQTVELRRRIHEEPELGLELPATRSKVLEALEGLDHELRLHAKSSGVAATLRGARPGRRVLLRGDMDALPMPEDTELPFRSRREGVMHACGHDAHTAMLVGAAHLLADRRDQLAGEVVFMFQPGEEGHHGARWMIEEGVLEGVEAAFALHITPLMGPGTVGTRSGPLMASADFFQVEVVGKGGHASMPHDCVDPVPVACELVQALQTFVTRRIPAFDPVVLTVSRILAGTTGNVIPERAELLGTLRAFSERARDLAREGIHRVAEHVARAHGCEARVELETGYPVTCNDAAAAALVIEVGTELLGRGCAVEMPAPVMGAEDFAYVLERVPGAMAFLGVRPEGVEEPAPCHSNRMQLDEGAMVYGTALHAAMAIRMLERGLPASGPKASGAASEGARTG